MISRETRVNEITVTLFAYKWKTLHLVKLSLKWMKSTLSQLISYLELFLVVVGLFWKRGRETCNALEKGTSTLPLTPTIEATL